MQQIRAKADALALLENLVDPDDLTEFILESFNYDYKTIIEVFRAVTLLLPLQNFTRR